MTRIDATPGPWERSRLASRDFAMLAHDIRGALNGVIGGIALIDRSRVDPEMRLQVERVSAAAQALASLFDDAVGSASKVSADGDEAAVVDVAAFLHFIERRWSGEAREKGLGFSIDGGPGLPDRLLVEFLDLSRVVGNLVGNAIKFSDHGSVRLSLRRSAHGGLALTVRDEGPGVGEGELDQVFDYGYRRTDAHPGQGIGLHIAKLLTQRMGGDITLANRAEGGVEAVVRLPGRLCVGGSAGDGRPGGSAARDEAEGGKPDLTGVRILLAEDNPTNQMVASQMLRSLNAVVTLAADGVEALQHFEAEEFDLVVVDIEMPRKSGLDVIREIRARGDLRARVPIIALTAYAMQEHRTKIADAGANGLISKPIISIETFGRTVAAHVRPAPPPDPSPAAEGAEAAAGPAVDRAIFDALAEAIGRETMAELVDRIVADLETNREVLARALDPLDVAAIRSSSHILISVGGAFGAARLQGGARALNTAAHAPAAEAEPSDALVSGVRVCLGEIAVALDFLRAERLKC